MVNSKRYDPTITRFRKHTQGFVSGKTKKGHLQNEENDKGSLSYSGERRRTGSSPDDGGGSFGTSQNRQQGEIQQASGFTD